MHPDWLTIAASAVVGALAKELVAWLLTLFRRTLVGIPLRAKLNAIFAKHNREVMSDAAMLCVIGFWIYQVGWTDDRLSGKDVLVLVGLSLLYLLYAVFLLVDLVRAVIIENAKAKDGAPPA